jgi:competence protein ComGC
MKRVLSLCLVVLALALFVSMPALAADQKGADKAADKGNTHTGKIVKVDANKLTMVGKDAKDEHTHTLAPDAQVTIDGKQAKLEDLKKDMFVRVTTKEGDKNTAIKVEASNKAFEDKDLKDNKNPDKK